MNRKFIKKLVVVVLAAILFVSCAATQTDFCPQTVQGKLFLKIRNIPADKWHGPYYDTFTTRRKKTNISISKKGNLFINDHYIHIPWKHKLQFQKFYQRIRCCKSKTNRTSTYFKDLMTLFDENI
jgi:hypothetical protein